MNIIKDISKRLEKVELRYNPVIIRVNKFDEEAAEKFSNQMSAAQSTGPLIEDRKWKTTSVDLLVS